MSLIAVFLFFLSFVFIALSVVWTQLSCYTALFPAELQWKGKHNSSKNRVLTHRIDECKSKKRLAK
jgi:hypothetical protein